jgi:hypothetical protein
MHFNIISVLYCIEALGGAVGRDNELQVGRSRIRFQVSLEFFIDIILPAEI